MTIYDSIKKLANERNMSIAEIERAAGMTKGTIGRWRTKKPKLEAVMKVADALNVGITMIISV